MAWVAAILIATFACSAPASSRYEGTLLRLLKEGTGEAALAHREVLHELLAEAAAEGRKPAPGLRLEAAALAAEAGERGLAEDLLNAEERDHPRLRGLIDAMRRSLFQGEPR